MASVKSEARKMTAQGKERWESRCRRYHGVRTPELASWGSHDIPNQDNSCTLRADLPPHSALLFVQPLSHPLAAVSSPHPSPLAHAPLAFRQSTNHFRQLIPRPVLLQHSSSGVLPEPRTLLSLLYNKPTAHANCFYVNHIHHYIGPCLMPIDQRQPCLVNLLFTPILTLLWTDLARFRSQLILSQAFEFGAHLTGAALEMICLVGGKVATMDGQCSDLCCALYY